MIFRFHHEQVLAAFARLEATVVEQLKEMETRIMAGLNTSAANLQAQETAIEGDLTKLGSALTTAFADLKAEVQAALAAAGVPNSVVDGITSKFAAVDTTIQGLTATATAADPGPQTPATPATPTPAA
jgi:hypothetical protein